MIELLVKIYLENKWGRLSHKYRPATSQEWINWGKERIRKNDKLARQKNIGVRFIVEFYDTSDNPHICGHVYAHKELTAKDLEASDE